MGQTIWVGAVAYDPKVVTIWEGMRRYSGARQGRCAPHHLTIAVGVLMLN